MIKNSRLNPIQESLLRLFDRGMSEEEILTLRNVIVKHYSELLKTEVEWVVGEKGYTQEDFDRMLNNDA
ncbi:hypothetical protein [Salmonirosea aquatica]|uniref:Uncharacterized protein n=1 Tax=Salmonirosea aquatica TaxID=2654236 RepID=A0A7C9BB69_9BACT|nr:hypothetical protein [Cytophagaceae bacterium SJW1-29]